jgi:arylsulfatase A-like enzyme/Flp pilus assembly protein TadD
VLITLDTTRADRLGVMGDPAARTPTLDDLAARGVVFERAYSSVPLTLPSHTTMLTGLEPPVHGVHVNGRLIVPDSAETVTEQLAARGYATAAFVSAFVLDSVFGLDQGFEVYDDETDRFGDPLRLSVPTRRGAEVTTRALAWLDRVRRPFFLWAHYYDVHAPRQPPPPFDELGDPYAGELAYVDAQLASLLEGVARAARGGDTLLIVVGDHGESLGEHGELTHGLLAYDAVLHVPLIAAGPGFPPGKRSRAFVRTVDVAPTILAAAGVTSAAQGPGRPLQETLGSTVPSDGVSYFQSFEPEYAMGWARIGGVRDERWKYTAEPTPAELYDTIADPREVANRAADEPEIVARLQEAYDAVRVVVAEPAASPLHTSPDVQEKLAALGYLVAAVAPPSGERPDPREVIGAQVWVERARSLALEGRVAAGVQALEILAESPVVGSQALRSLAYLYLQVGRADDAVVAYARIEALTKTPTARVDLANALLQAGRAEDALRTLDSVAGTQEPPARLRLARARALIQLGRAADAEREVAAVLTLDRGSDAAQALASRIRAGRQGASVEIARLQELLRDDPDARRWNETQTVLVELLHLEGRDKEAVEILEGAGEPLPEHRAILAGIAAARGNPEKAIALYESVVADRPTNRVYRTELAQLYGEIGRLDDALALYDELIAVNPDDPAHLVNRGATLFALGRLKEAEADYRRALTLDDALPVALLNLALIELSQGREEEAEKNLLRAVELRDDYAKAHFHLARIYRGRGDPRATAHAEQAVLAGPGVVSDVITPSPKRPSRISRPGTD